MNDSGGQACPKRAVVEALARTARALVGDFDLSETLYDLATDAVDALDGDLVGIMLANRSGGLFLVASSDEGTDAIGLLRLQIYQRGPCIECLNTGQVISVEGLGVDTDRWSSFVTAAIAFGFRTVHALPMRWQARTVGVLSLLRTDSSRLPTCDVALAQGFADLAVLSLHQQHCLAHRGHLAEQLHATLNSRAALDRARRVLTEESHLQIHDTFAPLRDYARAHHLRLTELAQRITADHVLARQVLAARF
ncbi:GAF and ANTAR domain-containing protein [Saccharopolyspora sp. WRP15-2]|uniref:GAF and ANTAR domain-containing protein n=1 Tax=Saccharopolyspora oryzae TaxID=2997343 RepID=A0ABT4UQB1_9PSEU|nr:GAF and ANTAR domain-containing protein [Saccharopolyspora oryzae]MDA3623910.1 GAF and ANTAR domain-containing protein [Saccharopolyspora oryzae]